MDALGAAARNPYSLAERLLGIVAGALDNNVPHSRAAPQRQYVAHGTPVLDMTDQLTVHMGSIRPSSLFNGADPGVSSLPNPKLILVDLTVTLVNTYPTGVVQQGGGRVHPLTTDVLESATEQTYIDGWTAYSAVWFGWSNCAPQGANGELHSLSPLLPIDPEGGAAGWQFTLTTEIPRLRQEL